MIADPAFSLVLFLLALDAGLTFAIVRQMRSKQIPLFSKWTGRRLAADEIEANALARACWRKFGLARGTIAAYAVAAALIGLATQFIFTQTWFLLLVAGTQIVAIQLNLSTLREAKYI